MQSSIRRLALLVILACAAPALPQDVRVVLSKNPIAGGETVRISVILDFPFDAPNRPTARETYHGGEAPIFEITTTRDDRQNTGTLKRGAISGAEWLNSPGSHGGEMLRTLPVESSPGQWRVRSQFDLDYTEVADPVAGVVMVVAEREQMGVTLKKRFVNYRALARLNVLGSGAGAPPRKPPFTATSTAVNPTTKILTAVGVTVAVLIALGLAGHSKSSTDPEASTGAETPQPAKAPAPAAEEPAASPRPPPTPPQSDQPTYQLSAQIRPTTPIQVVEDGTAARTYDYRGDGQQWLQVAIGLQCAPGSGWTPEFDPFEPASPLPSDPLDRWQGDPAGGWYDEALPPNASVLYLTVLVPWFWETRFITFNLPKIKFKLSKGTLTQRQHRFGPSLTQVSILGAHPALVATAEQREILATGAHGTRLESTLWLFHQPAPAEKVELVGIKGIRDDPRSERDQLGSDGGWIAPFLLADATKPEVLQLKAHGRWTGGPAHARSGAAPGKHLDARPCEVHLLGCSAVLTEPRTEFFCPLPGAPLFTGARIIDAQGQPVPNPFSRQSVHAPGAHVRVDVRDLSQAPPGALNGCKLPPRSLLDVPQAGLDGAAAARGLIARTPVDHVIPAGQLLVDGGGNVYSAAQTPFATDTTFSAGGVKTIDVLRDQPPRIFLGNYALRPNCEPIHDGPVVYTLVFDDGFGGTYELPGLCRVALGSLVLETGGEDFRLYDYRPSAIPVTYEAGPYGYAPRADDRDFTITWEFAHVDAEGKPLMRIGYERLPFEIVAGKSDLILGHMPSSRPDIYIDKADGSVVYAPPAEGPLRWRKVDATDRSVSRRLRDIWYQVPQGSEQALGWLPLPGAHGALTDRTRPWRDRLISMSVRLELRDAAGNLLATSDRLMEVGRTPPEYVWRDHRFGFVPTAVRLLLKDAAGNPIANRPYHFEIHGRTLAGHITDQGMFQQWPPPDAEEGTLTVTGADDKPLCTLRLKLGQLETLPPDRRAEALLNNLGYSASSAVTAVPDPERKFRAVQRFQYTNGLPITGQLDEETLARLEDRHDV